jgi:hypothetical protein
MDMCILDKCLHFVIVHYKKLMIYLTGKNAISDIKYKWSNYHIFYNLYIA